MLRWPRAPSILTGSEIAIPLRHRSDDPPQTTPRVTRTDTRSPLRDVVIVRRKGESTSDFADARANGGTEVIEYFGLVGLVGVGLTAAFLLYVLAMRLRKATGTQEAAAPTPANSKAVQRTSGSTSRYFLLAVVGLALHTGAFYFYLWGASVRSAGLGGLLIMVVLGFCLITGVFYSWARGTVSYPARADEASELLE